MIFANHNRDLTSEFLSTKKLRLADSSCYLIRNANPISLWNEN
jgi:hypothetical protein